MLVCSSLADLPVVLAYALVSLVAAEHAVRVSGILLLDGQSDRDVTIGDTAVNRRPTDRTRCMNPYSMAHCNPPRGDC